jgi:hypothetical protein
VTSGSEPWPSAGPGDRGDGVGRRHRHAAAERGRKARALSRSAADGLVPVPITHHLVAPEFAYVLRDSGGRVFVAHARCAEAAGAAADEVGLPRSGRLPVADIAGFSSYAGVTPTASSVSEGSGIPTGRVYSVHVDRPRRITRALDPGAA